MKELLTCTIMFMAIGLCHAATKMPSITKEPKPTKLEAVMPTICWDKELPAKGE